MKTIERVTPKNKKNIKPIEFVSKNSIRLALTGVYYKDGYATSSDGYMLFHHKENYSKEFEGKIIDKYNCEIKGVKYVSIQCLLNELITVQPPLPYDLNDLQSYVEGVLQYAKNNDYSKIDIYKTVLILKDNKNDDIYLYVKQLEKVLKAAQKIGATRLYFTDSHVFAKTENGTIVTMRVRYLNELDEKYIFRYDIES